MMPIRLPVPRRLFHVRELLILGRRALALAGLLTALTLRAPAADAHRPASTHDAPILGGSVALVYDGTAPFEDRPIEVPGLGTLPGIPGVPDPGDDPGPRDQVVRSSDAVAYRVAYSVRSATAEDLEVEITLSGPAVWEPARVTALSLSGCPGGADLLDGGKRVHCVVGDVEAPPAITVALDLVARVDTDALQGETLDVSAIVRAPGAAPDPSTLNCPVPLVDGCQAVAPPVTVSAAPAFELRKHLLSSERTVHQGQPGWRLTWRLDAVAGADGDVRGTSSPVGAPWVLPDWWRATSQMRGGVDLPVELLECSALDPDTDWTCAQPDGPGEPVEVTMAGLGAVTDPAAGVQASSPQVVGGLQMTLWVPAEDVNAAGWDVTLTNCFATEIGDPRRALWAPADAAGEPNLGGMSEPTGNNCAAVVLPVPRPNRPPRRPPPRDPIRTPQPPPRPEPTPEASVSKRYAPMTSGDSVYEGMTFASEVSVHVFSQDPLPNVVACDKWDNTTQRLREGDVSGVQVWWRTVVHPAERMDPEVVTVEYAAGPWGRSRGEATAQQAWYAQSIGHCTDRVALEPGWVEASEIDFENRGTGTLNAEDVNMVRVRFLEPVEQGTTVWMEVLLEATRSRTGTWLMNYGAATWGSRGRWQSEACYGVSGIASRRQCPVPTVGTRGRPGLLGDMLVYAGVPVWVTKLNDPVVPGGSPVVPAGGTTAFVLEARTDPRPDAPPPPELPPGAYAAGVVVTDTLPVGLTYLPGSATLASEDLNGNNQLDPGEDRNGNGRLDTNVAFEPEIQALPGTQGALLLWQLGDLPANRRAPAIRFEAQVSRLVRGGTTLVNGADARASDDVGTTCDLSREGNPLDQTDRRLVVRRPCAWAQVIVMNDSAAQVEKVAVNPVVEAGAAMEFRLGLANTGTRPVEWFDVVDLLPWRGDGRRPPTQLTGDIETQTLHYNRGNYSPYETWASASDPGALDILGGGVRDGLVDPVAAWGGPGSGLGGPDWPCKLEDVGAVGTNRCREIASPDDVTAVRLYAPDPHPSESGTARTSALPVDSAPLWLTLTLDAPGSRPGDLAHNAWGGRFGGLPLPVFDDAVVRVPGPATSTPVATATPSPTAADPTLTPTSTPTATATRTPTGPGRIYLPSAINAPCTGGAVDVALVIDVSSSMRRDAGDGRTKLDAVLNAARTFLDGLDPEATGSRVAVVAFNDTSWIAQPLTSDRARLDGALAALAETVAEGTRLDLALERGAEALSDVEPGRLKAMVFLTDGMPNRVPTPAAGGTQEDTVLAAAERARNAGVVIHTVGYGRADAQDLADRILPWLLRAIAGDAGDYHETDDATALADVFRRLAITVRCGQARVWP